MHNENEIEVKANAKLSPLVGAIVLMVAVVAYTFFVRPLSSEVEVMQTSVVKQTAEIETLQADIDEMQKAEKELDLTTKIKQQRAKDAIPQGINQDDVIREIMDITSEHDIELKSIGFGKGGTSEEGISSLHVNASFDGNYADLIGFLKEIEQAKRLYKVSSISVQVSEIDVLDLIRATFSLSIEAYYQEA